MELAPEEVRVVACLIEKEATVPDSYPLTLNALRLACNQTTNRDPVVAYDDRTVENALLSLKSMGLVRFVHPSHGGRTIRYRHVADERWHLSKAEARRARRPRAARPADGGRGAVTGPRRRRRAGHHRGDPRHARRPQSRPVRRPVGAATGRHEARWAHVLCGEPDSGPPPPIYDEEPVAAPPDLARDVAELWLASSAWRSCSACRRTSARSLLVLGVDEVERQAVHAEALTRRRRAVGEDVAEV